ncbi:PREDICTED: uncharacterized protein LOC105565450 isoform X2 [Vollenhovia emeryi]|uniref:uncharacterized protein LOC105565450 isoform X2 n=1 Tax=Vollenhovia emeryi TaxID=411798 RepID=UPI0005F3CF29|nr:PREDICTED: uncharacterized protein LOC105565450 isoform X2 [Vollenhovia emeryi]
MNFTEQCRARILAFLMPPSEGPSEVPSEGPSEGPISGWKGALRITVLAVTVGFGIYVLLFKKKDSSSGRWSFRTRRAPIERTLGTTRGTPIEQTLRTTRGTPIEQTLRTTRGTQIEPDDISRDTFTEIKELSDDRSIVTYNGEICPICLGVPKIGVRAPCGHSLCAECLANYCDVRITPAPPPCPLCRAPLNSVALTCDFAILGSKMLDPNTVMVVQDWIREYNNHQGIVTSIMSWEN